MLHKPGAALICIAYNEEREAHKYIILYLWASSKDEYEDTSHPSNTASLLQSRCAICG
jgi:hypothetical protein